MRFVEADAEQLNQVFVNFFINAEHAMSNGGELTVMTSIVNQTEEEFLMRGICLGDQIQVDIQDTGTGISAEDVIKIFDPFYTTKDHGVGLGLSVAHGIIQEHKGTIDVDSQLGKGTVFRVRLPLLDPKKKVKK